MISKLQKSPVALRAGLGVLGTPRGCEPIVPHNNLPFRLYLSCQFFDYYYTRPLKFVKHPIISKKFFNERLLLIKIIVAFGLFWLLQRIIINCYFFQSLIVIVFPRRETTTFCLSRHLSLRTISMGMVRP